MNRERMPELVREDFRTVKKEELEEFRQRAAEARRKQGLGKHQGVYVSKHIKDKENGK